MRIPLQNATYCGPGGSWTIPQLGDNGFTSGSFTATLNAGTASRAAPVGTCDLAPSGYDICFPETLNPCSPTSPGSAHTPTTAELVAYCTGPVQDFMTQVVRSSFSTCVAGAPCPANDPCGIVVTCDTTTPTTGVTVQTGFDQRCNGACPSLPLNKCLSNDPTVCSPSTTCDAAHSGNVAQFCSNLFGAPHGATVVNNPIVCAGNAALGEPADGPGLTQGPVTGVCHPANF